VNRQSDTKLCIIVPTYNNAATLSKVLEELKSFEYQIIVVNDGSTDSTAEILRQTTGIDVCSYPKNRGKGYALQTGFRRAVEMGFDYALTIDSDGQHYPADIPLLTAEIAENPDSIIIGTRNLSERNMPSKNTFANKFANFWFKVETGIKAGDTQSGFRIYPLAQVANRKYFTCRYDFELEALVRSIWDGAGLVEAPVRVYYPPENERVSHFKPALDFTRISILNTCLVFIAFFWIKPRNFFRQINRESVKKFFHEQILATTFTDAQIALSVAIGILCGIIPIWGYQMIVAFSLAHFFRLNKAIALVASNISIPPMIPFILYWSIKMGAWITGNVDTVRLSDISFSSIKNNLMIYLVGSFALAVTASAITGVITYMLLKLFRK